MKKRILLLMFLTIIAFSVSSCGKKGKYEGVNENENTNTVTVAGKIQNAGELEYVIEDYTLEDIAELNGMEVEQLNVLYGRNGGIVFLGDKFGEEIVTNEEEAMASLEHVKTLAQLEGVDLVYNRTDISPVTGNIVYTFYQTANTELDGEVVTAKFYNSLIKVITDSDGNLVGVSADIVPENDMEYIEKEEIITKGEAIEYVKSVIDDKNRMVYEDISEYAFWDDEGTVFSVNTKSKVSPAWFIYTDSAPDNVANKPYEVFVVSLNARYSFDDDDELSASPAILSSYFVETLDFNDALDVYTSTFYFDGMEDAGEYSYEVDLSWAKKYFEDYKGPDKTTITVPVMYSSKEDIYYIGDLNKKITMSNYYDFEMLDTTNAYVTKTPDKKDSWHFQLDKADDGSTGIYFDNPDYVLSSFSVMCDVWTDFYERYGLDSVDGTGLPTMLCVYAIDGYEYPENESDFMENAVNMGQKRDWQVMASSITLPNCLEHEVMAHEYTHGINGQLTMSQYFNGAGAVMESYADIIGEQISMLNNYPECSDEYEWHLGGMMGRYMRNMANPYEFNSPMYIGGNYYLNPVDAVISESLDAGGVHTNSSILNYLSYCMVNGTGEGNEATLTMDECLDVWFDTLYYTNYQTDYFDVATYLTLSAETMGLEENKYDFLRQLLTDFGFIPDADGESYVTYTEDSDYYNINIEYDNSEYDDLADEFKFGVVFFDENDNYYCAGGLNEESMSYGVQPGTKFSAIDLIMGTMFTEDTLQYQLDEADEIPHNIDIIFTPVVAAVGQNIEIDSGFELSYLTTNDDMECEIKENEEGPLSLNIESEGYAVMTLKDLNKSSDDYGKYKVYYVLCQE